MLLSGLVDLPRVLSLGPITALALLTVMYAGLAWMLWLPRPLLARAAVPVAAPLVAFMVWGFASISHYAPTVDGLQNLLVVAAFTGLVLLTAGAVPYVRRLPHSVGRMLAWAAWIAVALYAIGIAAGGWGTDVVLGPRSFAMFALLGLAWHLADWRHGHRRSLWWGIVMVLMIGASLSRLALAASLVLLPLSQISFRSVWGWLRVVLWIALAIWLFVLAFTYVEPLRSRFVEGDVNIEVGGVAVNGSGRDEIWNTVVESYAESPWIGKGAGSANEVVKAHFVDVNHPHSDYLRILHDYGPVGLGLWIVAFAGILWKTFRAWMRADLTRAPDARVHAAAFLATVAASMVMITDNAMVYVFVMAPLGILVGASLGSMSESGRLGPLTASSSRLQKR